ncbi:hypothetical protein [Sulfurimonas paralvinellae]|uniref:Uncharacterized protein n=1 Tax=Sulfurimonas paralvinellae TaxID=317658 RepID=A0A7M1B7J5_9BACT|nr:hypothetical protein [Sulfurimonas paralvinellae]QOP45660.1 hypothetical protein FM071_04910 [Sulfurimonas paralvinellae]
MKKISLKLLIAIFIASAGTNSFAKDCNIMTSPIDLSRMTFAGSSYYLQTIPIVAGKTFKYTSFFDAYQEFEKNTRKWFKDTICKEKGLDGVANYKIQWQQTDKMYYFTATFDAYENK